MSSTILCHTCFRSIEENDLLALAEDGQLKHAECPINFHTVVEDTATQLACKNCARSISAEDETMLDPQDNLIHTLCVEKLFAPQDTEPRYN